MTDSSERMREKQGLAAVQARELAEAGYPLLTPVRHVWRVRATGQRTLHTVVASWAEDMVAECGMQSPHRSWYRRPTLGDVLTGEVKL